MNWALFDSPHDPGSDWPDIGSRPASRARGFAPTSNRDGRLTRAIRDIGDSFGIGLFKDELHYRTNSATDCYDDYVNEMRTRFAPKPVDEKDIERVAFLRTRIDICYNQIANLLLVG